MKKIGSLISALLFLTNASVAHAAISASVDRTQVPQDESISLKITQVSGDTAGSFSPKFEAPDFEVMNQFESSQFSSVYINGKFENKSEKSVTYILRPLKVGTLKIRNISSQGDRAPDLTIQSTRENAYQKSAGDTAPSLQGDQRNFFVRAEPSKTKAYRGEQVIVSFYMYRRTKANIRDVMQHPSFEGFLREDMEMPILAGRPLEFEAVNLGGVPFERALLARYALYPIKEGKLKIDGFSIRADYIPRNAANDDLMEDPFFQFFSQVNPRTATSKSDPVTVEVVPLPEDSRGSIFTGGVGDFEVSSSVNQAQIKTNVPLTLKVVVQGHGNASLIEFPKVNWPKEFKFYETQGHSKNLGQGVTEKTFEVVLIPLQTGELTIPSISFEFFNPSTRSYSFKKTNPIRISVSQGEASSTEHPPEDLKTDSVQASPSNTDPKSYGALRTNENSKTDASGSFMGQPWWRWIAWAGLIMLLSFLGLITFDHLRKKSILQLEGLKRKEKFQSVWVKFLEESKAEPLPLIFEKVSGELYKTLDESFDLASRSLPLRELAKTLTEQHGFSSGQWKQLSQILEFSEMIRFASQSTPQDSELRAQAQEMIEKARNLCASISSKKLDS